MQTNPTPNDIIAHYATQVFLLTKKLKEQEEFIRVQQEQIKALSASPKEG